MNRSAEESNAQVPGTNFNKWLGIVVVVLLLTFVITLITIGVISTNRVKARRMTEWHLKQFALRWHEFYDQHRRSPKNLEEIQEFRTGGDLLFPGTEDISPAAELVSEGRFIIAWNSIFPKTGEPFDNYLLGYEPEIVDKPALVMTAGGAVREISPEEFRSLRAMEIRKD